MSIVNPSENLVRLSHLGNTDQIPVADDAHRYTKTIWLWPTLNQYPSANSRPLSFCSSSFDDHSFPKIFFTISVWPEIVECWVHDGMFLSVVAFHCHSFTSNKQWKNPYSLLNNWTPFIKDDIHNEFALFSHKIHITVNSSVSFPTNIP